ARPNAQDAARGGGESLGVYNIPNARLESFMVYTNLVPSGNMRAPGSFHRGHAGEVHIDHIARELGMDPLEFRLLNCIREGDTTPGGGHTSRPRAVEVLEALKRETNWGSALTHPSPPEGARGVLRGRGLALRDRHVGAGKTEILFRLQ